jgi:1-deoxy-D-xylulose-5-phosphate reductoisomerase
MADMRFESFDSGDHRARYPGLALAWEALAATPGTTAVLNAANEVAVAAFLDRRIRFDQIHAVNVETLAHVSATRPATLEQILALDRQARECAQSLVKSLAS